MRMIADDYRHGFLPSANYSSSGESLISLIRLQDLTAD